MYIKKLKASFGKLQGEELSLNEGLNIIEAPNEAGKSTWSHFIRAMFYGVSTSERSRSGSVPDKQRFRPWGSLPMEGLMELNWKGKDITLSRAATGGDKPMGGCIVTYTGTGERIPELMGKNTGELLLGITEPVYRRSAFITRPEIAVEKDAELEKRITALVTSGEENYSYTDADERLRRWLRKRRYRTDGGRLPEAEGQLRQVKQALRDIEAESTHLADLREKVLKLEKQRELLELELRRHLRDERLEAANKLSAAEQRRSELEESIRTLEAEIGEIKDTDLNNLALEGSRLAVQEKALSEAERDLEAAESEFEALPKTVKQGLGTFGIASIIFGIFGAAAIVTAIISHLWFILVAVLICAVIVTINLLLRAKAVNKLKAENNSKIEIAAYKVSSAKERLVAARQELETISANIASLLKKLKAGEGEKPESVIDRLTASIAKLQRLRIEAEAAKERCELLKAAVTGEAENIQGQTKLSKQDAETYLKQTVSEYDRLSRELVRGEGGYSRLGDPLLLSTEEVRLTNEILALEKEYRALNIAIETMREANLKLQALFSPLISREAGRLMSIMTSGSYKSIYFDKDLRFSAERAEDMTAHSLEFLSDGTKDQLYLAVRLAVCSLALPKPPEEEACPLVLDDVLDSFDDVRAEQALRLLKELSGERQIILFTCHSREKRIAASL
jgi:DNA repair exonuclease SbcCD ATPase subunit